MRAFEKHEARWVQFCYSTKYRIHKALNKLCLHKESGFQFRNFSMFTLEIFIKTTIQGLRAK